MSQELRRRPKEDAKRRVRVDLQIYAALTHKIDIVSLTTHELSESVCGPVLLHNAFGRRADVCLSRTR